MQYVQRLELGIYQIIGKSTYGYTILTSNLYTPSLISIRGSSTMSMWGFDMSVSSCASYNASHPNISSEFMLTIPLKPTNSCSWIDNYLAGNLSHPSNSTLADMLHSGLSADLYDDNLSSCYNQSPGVFMEIQYSHILYGCCGDSAQATGDPDLGGIGVRL